MIKAVLFDFGGVLTPGGGSGSIKQLFAEILGLDAGEVQIDDLHVKLRRGEISDAAFFSELNRRHPNGLPATRERLLAHADIFRHSAPVYELAVQLREQGIKTGMLSNMYKVTADALQEQGFYDGFAPLVLSCNEHLSKPDPAFYRIAIERLGVKPQEIIFIDDQSKCLPPAQALGMHTVWAKDAGQIVHDTKAIIRYENGLEL